MARPIRGTFSNRTTIAALAETSDRDMVWAATPTSGNEGSVSGEKVGDYTIGQIAAYSATYNPANDADVSSVSDWAFYINLTGNNGTADPTSDTTNWRVVGGGGTGVEIGTTLPTVFTDYPVGTLFSLSAVDGSNPVGLYRSTGTAWTNVDTDTNTTLNLSDVETFTSTALRNADTTTVWHRGDLAVVTGDGTYVYTGNDQNTASATTDADWTLLVSGGSAAISSLSDVELFPQDQDDLYWLFRQHNSFGTLSTAGLSSDGIALTAWDLTFSPSNTVIFTIIVGVGGALPAGFQMEAAGEVSIHSSTADTAGLRLTGTPTVIGNVLTLTLDRASTERLKLDSARGIGLDTSFLTIRQGIIRDNMGRHLVVSTPTQVRNWIPYPTRPSIGVIVIDDDESRLSLGFRESIDVSTFTPTALTIHSADTGGTSYTLTSGSTTASSNGSRITITLSSADVAGIQALGSDLYATWTDSLISNITGVPVTVRTTPRLQVRDTSFISNTSTLYYDDSDNVWRPESGTLIPVQQDLLIGTGSLDISGVGGGTNPLEMDFTASEALTARQTVMLRTADGQLEGVSAGATPTATDFAAAVTPAATYPDVSGRTGNGLSDFEIIFDTGIIRYTAPAALNNAANFAGVGELFIYRSTADTNPIRVTGTHTTIGEFILDTASLNVLKLDSTIATSVVDTFFNYTDGFVIADGQYAQALSTPAQVVLLDGDFRNPTITNWYINAARTTIWVRANDILDVSGFDATGITVFSAETGGTSRAILSATVPTVNNGDLIEFALAAADTNSIVALGAGPLFATFAVGVINDWNFNPNDAITDRLQETQESNLDQERIVGVTTAAIASGASGAVTLSSGVSTGHTGLTINADYYVQEDGTLSTNSASPAVRVGKAISATALKLYAEYSRQFQVFDPSSNVHVNP